MTAELGDVVAKLAYPMAARAMVRLGTALEALYGKGLVVDGAHPDADKWMVVRRAAS